MRVLITGGGGFIGRALCAQMRDSHSVSASFRTASQVAQSHPAVKAILVPDIGPSTNWEAHLHCIDAVVHLAARAHVLDETDPDPSALFHRVNVLAAQRLAQQAAQAGVRRFVFVSSVGVYGRGYSGVPLTELLPPTPVEPYAISKGHAEIALRKCAAETGMDLVIVRPPLVYGPEVPGNFLKLLNAIKRQTPLPFGCARSPQSMVGIRNLVSLLQHCVESVAASGQTLLVSDGEDIGLRDLCRQLAEEMAIPSRLLPVPRSAFWIAAQLTRRTALYDRVFRPLTIDSSKARNLLGWHPPFTVADGLAETARWFARKSDLTQSQVNHAPPMIVRRTLGRSRSTL